MNYRREIDGLRALAVLPVLLFHAGFKPFSGGYVGVDVFFVISGYLITFILLKSLSEGRFSLLEFYERRMRRILPALFLVLLVSFGLAWMWMLPADMERYSASLASVPVFASNILFWRSSGYFDADSTLKPLLHTWSLAVEEQFYLAYPLLLVLLWFRGGAVLVAVLALVAIVSFSFAQWSTALSPSFKFYLLPTRAWELALGAMAAICLWQRATRTLDPRLQSAGALLGLTLIAFAVFAFDETTPFPGVHGLVPTLGTALIICFASERNWAGKLLSNRVLVGIGLVSYSAYLWHQPLLSLARHRALGPLDAGAAAALVIASLALAALSWKYVEQPFRDPRKVSRSRTFAFAAAGSALIIAVGLLGLYTNGFSIRLPAQQREFLAHFHNSPPELRYHMRELTARFRDDCNFYDLDAERRGYATRKPRAAIADSCYTRDAAVPNAVFIWGDSHAQQLHQGLRDTLPPDWQVLQVASSRCPARVDVDEHDDGDEDYCGRANRFALKTIAKIRPEVVVVAQAEGHSEDAARSIGQHLRRLGAKKVIFMGPTPQWTAFLPGIVVRRAWPDPPRRLSMSVNPQVLRLDERLKSGLRNDTQVEYFSIIDRMCDSAGCLVYLGDRVKEGLTSYDNAHLTPIAAEWLARLALVDAVTWVDGSRLHATPEPAPAAPSPAPEGAATGLATATGQDALTDSQNRLMTDWPWTIR